ncbi:hypothetical protein QFW77_11210 [Luteimonas sp. RD2P54]|uniref:Uncharacterized protein n=1 Tax=Luteimonas endophytica TaxID=3042023 RepID=A0ABT6J9Q4_9GAMM|nr:hypothetical protein [Luteimonas endophytica]MDH5823554.1 hypothetical protein [Luteimonas endophytica]
MEALKIRAFGEKPAVSECFDLIMARVSSDPERFDRAYVQLKEQGFIMYPQWRSEIASIEIEALDIFPGKRCRAMVVFSGDANDMWICDSDGISFGDLVRR